MITPHCTQWVQVSALSVFVKKLSRRPTMPLRLGPTELMLILAIVVILFGANRIGKIGGELGKGLREFRTGLKGDTESEEK
jgi:sec-independent protein translocase protein TatA